MSLRSALLLGTIAAGTLATGIVSASAQDIEVITVTAAKREQNVQDVPISMNVIQQKDLEKYNLSDMKDISSQIPGMVFLKSNNISTVSLRGFGSSAANPAIDQTVALYMDGIFAGRAREYMLPFFDVARMEVLRGPQGALLGKNTAAGAINIVSANPTDEFEASASVSYLIDRKGVDAFGYVSGPVVDGLNARLAAKFVNKSGWVHNTATNTDVPEMDSKQVRLTLSWDPTENFNMVTKFGYETQAQEGKALSGFPVATLRGQINRTQNSPGLFGITDHDYQNGYHFSNTATVGFNDLTLVAITGVEAYTSNVHTAGLHMAPETIGSDYIDDFNQISQEFRLLSATGQTIEWIAGVYADYSSQRLDNISRYVGFPLGTINSQITNQFRQTAYTYSAYATGTWHATEELSVVLGLRGTQIHKQGNGDISVVNFGTPYPGLANHTVAGTIDEQSLDPSATIQYKVLPDVMVYAGWSKGSKGGAFQGATATITNANFAVRPEVSNNFEVGVKSTWWDWLTINATAYYLKFKNLQAGQYTGTPPVLITKNAAEAESKGVELVMNANLEQWAPGLSFGLTGNYIDARYTDYPGASCTYASTQAPGYCGTLPPGVLAPAAVTGVYYAGPLAGQQFNAKGLRFGALPVWQGTMQVNYTRPIMDGLKVELNLTADMQSSYWDDAGVMDARYGIQNGNTKLHFRVAVGDEDDRWSLAVIGRNVNDVLTTSAGVYAIPPARVYAIDEGRSISIQGTVKVN